jgi:ribosomal protein L37AE/L43A
MRKKNRIVLCFRISYSRQMITEQEAKPTCPRCQSTLTVRLANAWHCNSCGIDFGIEKNPIGREERHTWSGWPKNTA